MKTSRLARQAATLVAVVGILCGGATAGASTAKRHLPAHFPKPPHSRIVSETSEGTTLVYAMKVKSEVSAFKFWKRQLPRHGWTIKKAKSRDGSGGITFTGHGYGKNTAIGIDKRSVGISFVKSG